MEGPLTTPAAEPLIELLGPERLTTVVDIGANPSDGDAPYKTLLEKRLCRVIGFEPVPEALAALNSRKSDLELYLPHVVGDGTPGRLRVCRLRTMTSLFEPDFNAAMHFPLFADWMTVEQEKTVETRRLDDVAEIDAVDYLKMDVQGSELAVLRSGTAHLARAVAVQLEVSFVPLYRGQPTFGQIDVELRQLGFLPHAFAAFNKRMIAPLVTDNPYQAMNQLVEADMVYVRDFTRPEEMDDEQLKHLAVVAHYCYRSYDLALNCIHHLTKRGRIPQTASNRYVSEILGGRA
jgi:FkbM family methyltransferase